MTLLKLVAGVQDSLRGLHHVEPRGSSAARRGSAARRTCGRVLVGHRASHERHRCGFCRTWDRPKWFDRALVGGCGWAAGQPRRGAAEPCHRGTPLWMASQAIQPSVGSPRQLRSSTTYGLAVFVGVIGLDVGPEFLESLRRTGWALLGAGLVVVVAPNVLALLFGRFVLKMNPAILFGACVGASTSTAALGPLQGIGAKQSSCTGTRFPMP